MKKTLRPFVVETKHGKKPRSWMAEIDADVLSPSRQKAELSAAEVFSKFPSRSNEEAAAAAAPRVLQDLSQAPVPTAVETVEATAEDAEPKLERPRRGRPPKSAANATAANAVGADSTSVNSAAATSDAKATAKPVFAVAPGRSRAKPAPAALTFSFDDEDDDEPDLPVRADMAKGHSSESAAVDVAAGGLASDAAKARRSARRQVSKAELPRGQRWKRRLHPAAW